MRQEVIREHTRRPCNRGHINIREQQSVFRTDNLERGGNGQGICKARLKKGVTVRDEGAATVLGAGSATLPLTPDLSSSVESHRRKETTPTSALCPPHEHCGLCMTKCTI